jgi:hypothetical protein
MGPGIGEKSRQMELSQKMMEGEWKQMEKKWK